MTLTIKKTGVEDYLDGEGYVKALILGPPSAGKTRSAAFWPSPIFADCEKGRMSIADRAVPYAEIVSQKDMESLLAMLKAECRRPAHERSYRTLVIDTLDAFQRIVIQERLDAERKESLSGWGDWGYLDAKMSQFVARLVALPMNIVVNLHVKDTMVGDDDAKQQVVMPKLKGDLKDQIAAEFDLVGLMGTYWEAENGERVLKRGIQWHPDPQRPILKDRSGKLPKWTPVAFTEEDYSTLFTTLLSGMDGLAETEVVEELPSDEVPPAPPRPGGPVPNAPEPRSVLPKKPTPKLPPPAPPTTAPPEVTTSTAKRKAPAVPPAPRPAPAGATPAPAPEPAPEPAPQAPEPESEPEPDYVAEQEAAAPANVDTTTGEILDHAAELVKEELGGQVVSQEPAAETTGESDVPDAQPAAEESGLPVCGTGPGVNGQTAPGCGKKIGSDENSDLVQIAMLKTRTHLCNACYAAYRATNRK